MKVADIDMALERASSNMEKASEDDNTLDRTLFYSQQAVVTLLSGVLVELAAIRLLLKNQKSA